MCTKEQQILYIEHAITMALWTGVARTTNIESTLPVPPVNNSQGVEAVVYVPRMQRIHHQSNTDRARVSGRTTKTATDIPAQVSGVWARHCERARISCDMTEEETYLCTRRVVRTSILDAKAKEKISSRQHSQRGRIHLCAIHHPDKTAMKNAVSMATIILDRG